MSAVLAGLFFATALLYASVGFGGGSTYNALLVLNGTDYRVLPAIALICNMIVVSGGVWRFARAGYVSLQRLAPFLVASVPAAWIGGRIPISETLFVSLLGLSLLAAGTRLLFEQEPQSAPDGVARSYHWGAAAAVGGAIGLLAGLVGIGGGIFLAPVLYFWRWGTPRQIAGAASVFILVNSAAGLAGQAAKLNELSLLPALSEYWPLFPAVLIGGQIGSYLGSERISPVWVKRLTAALILYVAVRLLYRWAGMMGWF
ncbi:MAG: sulfite exporter TauE/SafE family protein [Pseudomonadota bacterium]